MASRNQRKRVAKAKRHDILMRDQEARFRAVRDEVFKSNLTYDNPVRKETRLPFDGKVLVIKPEDGPRKGSMKADRSLSQGGLWSAHSSGHVCTNIKRPDYLPKGTVANGFNRG